MQENVPYALQLTQHFVMSQAIFAAFEAGLWDEFTDDLDAEVSPEPFAREHQLEARYVTGLLEYLARRGLFEERGEGAERRFRLSDQGRELVGGHWLGYFVFMVGGYGEVLGKGGQLTRKELTYGRDVVRDGRYVALGSELQGKHPNHRSFAVVSEQVASVPSKEVLLDIGCGSARFMLNLLEKSGIQKGVGLDIDGRACELARENVKSAGLADRVRILEGDACAPLKVDPELADGVDLVTAMFIIHEFFGLGLDVAANHLREVARALKPDTGRFLIMDKHTDVFEAGEAPTYFTEFKLVHDLTNQRLINRAQWLEVLREAGLEITDEKVLAKHTGTILFECRRAA